jgi:pimeloyl-ACP methyl ester carboxylesterase
MLRKTYSRHGKAKTIAGKQVARSISNPWVIAGGALVGALALSAVGNLLLAQQAQRRNPPIGKFVTVNGVRLHYVDRGVGDPIVMLHGNGSMIQDFDASGIINLAAEKYRVVVFDRLGFGHTGRPSGAIWSPEAQADLLQAALAILDISRAVILGHSWGASLAVALALRHPQAVGSLVLASGYYYPTARPDFLAMSWPASPVIGTLIRHTVAPLLGRFIWPLLMRKIFGPAPTPEKFNRFPKAMALRPSQLHASAAESALLIPAAKAFCEQYRNLRTPVVIVAGAADRLINTDEQSVRLHRELPESTLHVVPGAGHMVHQTAPDIVSAAIHEAMTAAGREKSGISSLRAA